MRSKRVFLISEYKDMYQANSEARRYASSLTEGYRHRNVQPLLWVKFDKALQGYVIEPNELYLPHNPAWKVLQEIENYS